MKRLLTLLLICLPVVGMANATEVTSNTLAATKAMPDDLMHDLLPEAIADQIVHAPYVGFYRVDGRVRNNRVKFEKVKKNVSYPDEYYESLAVALAQLVELPAFSTGSRIKPTARAYVVLFQEGLEGIELGDVMHVPTNREGEPNVIAMLVVKQKGIPRARNMELSSASNQKSIENVHFFELRI